MEQFIGYTSHTLLLITHSITPPPSPAILPAGAEITATNKCEKSSTDGYRQGTIPVRTGGDKNMMELSTWSKTNQRNISADLVNSLLGVDQATLFTLLWRCKHFSATITIQGMLMTNEICIQMNIYIMESRLPVHNSAQVSTLKKAPTAYRKQTSYLTGKD